MESFNGMSDEGKKNTIVMLGLAASLGPVVTSIGGIAKVTSTAIKAIRDITAAQAALAGGASILALGITAIILAMNALVGESQSAVIEIRNHRQAYEDSTKAIDRQIVSENAQANLIDDLIVKYEELASKTSLTADEKTNLQIVIEKINSLLPGSIELINGETVKYNEQIEALKALSIARQNDLDLQYKEKNALTAKERIGVIDEDLAKAQKTLSDMEKKYPKNWLSGDITDLENFRSLFIPSMIYGNATTLRQEIFDLETEKQKKQAIIDDYVNFNPVITPKKTEDPVVSSLKSISEQTELYKKAIEEKKYLRDTGKIDEEKYYNELESLRNKYFNNYLTPYGKVRKDLIDGTAEEIDEFEALKKSIDVELFQGRNSLEAKTTKTETKAATQKSAAVIAFETEIKQLQYLRDTEKISLSEYYNELEKKSKKYLQNEKELAQEIEVEVYKGRQSLTTTTTKDVKTSEEIALEKFQTAKDKLDYERKKDLLSESKYYDEMRKLQEDFLTKDSSEWRSVNLDIYNYEKQVRQQRLDEFKDYNDKYKQMLSDRYNELKKSIEKEYTEINRIEDAQDRNKRLAELYTDQSLYSNAVTQAGRDKLKSIQDEIKSLNKEAQSEAREQEKQARLDSLEKQYEFAMTQQDYAFEAAQNNLNNFTDLISDSFYTISRAAAAAISSMSTGAAGGNKINITQNATVYDQPSAYMYNAWLLSQIRGY